MGSESPSYRLKQAAFIILLLAIWFPKEFDFIAESTAFRTLAMLGKIIT